MVNFPEPPETNPTTIAELFDFYHNYVKFYYGYVQAQNELPTETIFELNSVLDHLSRLWVNGEDEQKVVDKCYSHLKRCCLDVFKILAMDAKDQYKELCKINTGFVDNGEFDRELKSLSSDIRRRAREARRLEGIFQRKRDDKGIDGCFDLWQPVVIACHKLEEEFYLSPKVDWARKCATTAGVRTFAAGIMASIVAALIFTPDASSIFGVYAEHGCQVAAALVLLLLVWPTPVVLAFQFIQNSISDYSYQLRERRLSTKVRAQNRREVVEQYEAPQLRDIVTLSNEVAHDGGTTIENQ